MGEYYADLDDSTQMYCVFHTENSRAVASFFSLEEAQRAADRLNSATKVLTYPE